ncbi:MAG: beta-ketoacyl-[acyl-carrier-protein] synthase family protein [Victivallales bacterium]|nr:beta-ketoacyl-[acyl-carrier-protein] synthase family protein [Victivallales bacterium]
MRNDVIITGRGLVTPLGIGLKENEKALLSGKSGITYIKEWEDCGAESRVSGMIYERSVECPLLNRKNRRFLTPSSIFAIAATYQAMEEAGLTVEEFKKLRVAVVLGHGGSAHLELYKGAKIVDTTKKLKRVSPFTVPQAMPSANSANVSLIFELKGENYNISSACASSAHATAVASRLIRSGEYDIVVTGGAEELNWVHLVGFDAMRAISRKFNNEPERSSRPFDKDRDGFVIACGAGIVILESAEHAEKRGARKIAKISGLGANSNATDMVVPYPESCADVMNSAITDAGLKPADIDYINTHGTSTPVGDPVEIEAIKQVFYETNPSVKINSTKSQTGHMIGATAGVELIYSTQMMEKNFISGTINLENPEPGTEWANIIKKTIRNVNINHTLSNSLGFGGTNCCLIVSK